MSNRTEMELKPREIKCLKIDSFKSLIINCSENDSDFNIFVDGGAGLGETVNQMLEVCGESVQTILAFEPYPPNVSAFKSNNPIKTRLFAAALGSRNGTASFEVSQKTTNLDGNKYHIQGTSFVGKISKGVSQLGSSVTVEVACLADICKENSLDRIDFLKLDLQGGELDALVGLRSYLHATKVMWVEFSGQPGLLGYLQDNGFTVFDTEYLFVGDPNNLIEELFSITRVGKNSIGKSIFFGYRKHIWADYSYTLDFMRRRRRLIQTDLVAINNNYIREVEGYLHSNMLHVSSDVPDIIARINSKLSTRD